MEFIFMLPGVVERLREEGILRNLDYPYTEIDKGVMSNDVTRPLLKELGMLIAEMVYSNIDTDDTCSIGAVSIPFCKLLEQFSFIRPSQVDIQYMGDGHLDVAVRVPKRLKERFEALLSVWLRLGGLE